MSNIESTNFALSVGAGQSPKKLSYHIISYHPKITPKKCRSFCKNARIVNKKFRKPPKKLFFGRKGGKGERLLNIQGPSPKDENNSTRAMGSFPEDNLYINNFIAYLQTVDGKRRD